MELTIRESSASCCLNLVLTFDKAIELALAAEAADKDSWRLSGATTDKNYSSAADQAPAASQTPVHRVGQRRPQLNSSKQQGRQRGISSSAKSECHRCGGKHHPSSCPCKEFRCHFCKKRGHLAKMCRKKNKSRPEQANTVREEEAKTP